MAVFCAEDRGGISLPFWLKNLSVADVESLEISAHPGAETPRPLTEKEREKVMALLAKCDGQRVKNPETIYGQAITFSLTLKDGTKHALVNIGNVYLKVDETTFQVDHEWLASWDAWL